MPVKRILAFEADPVYAQMLEEQAQSRGYDITVVTDGNQGLKEAKATVPDAIYLSIELPRISGFSICNKLRKNKALKHIPLIISSSDATPATFEKHKKLKVRADFYLHKPFNTETLFEHVDRLLGNGQSTSSAEISEELAIDDEEVENMDDITFLDDEADTPGEPEAPPVEDLEEIEDLSDIEEIDELEELNDLEETVNLVDFSASGLLEQSLGINKPEEAAIPDPFDTPPTSASAPSQAEVEWMTSENQKLQEQVRVLRNELASSRSGRGGGVSSREFLDLREQLNKKDRELLDLKDAVNRAEKQLLDSRERLTELERDKADLEDRNLDLEKRIHALQEQITVHETDKEILVKKSEDLQSRIEFLQDKIRSLEGDLEKESRNRKADFSRLIGEKEDALKVLTDEKEEERAKALEEQQVEFERDKNRAMADQKADLDIQAEKHREEYLREQRVRHEATIEDLSAKLEKDKQDALDIQEANHSAKIAELEKIHNNALDKTERETARVVQEKNEIDAHLGRVQQELQSAQDELKETNQAVITADEEAAELRLNIEQLNEQNHETVTELDGRNKHVGELETTIGERDSRISVLINETEEANYIIDRNTSLIGKTRQALSIAAKLLDDVYYDDSSDTPND